MRQKTYVNGVEGVTPGGTSTINFPLERRYHALKFIATGLIAAAPAAASALIAKIRLHVNGVLQRDLTPLQYIALAKLNKLGWTPDNSEIPIFFSEPWRASVLGEEATSWDVFGQTKFTAEVVWNAGITQPALKVVSTYDFARNTLGGKPSLAIVKHLTQTYNAPAGQYDITSIPTTRPINRLYLSTAAQVISAVEVQRRGEKIHEGTVLENTRFLRDYDLDGSQFTFPIVFDYEQQVSSSLIVEREGDLVVRPTLAGADTLTVLIESRGNSFA